MANDIFELLATYGLKGSSDLNEVFRLSLKDLRKLHERLWTTLYRLQYENLPEFPTAEAFRFVASRHLRGDVCQSCRPQKLEFLARFAALYTDTLIVPLLLTSPHNRDARDEYRSEVRDAAEALILLRPLILGGIVRPTVMTTRNCCEFHAENLREFSELTHMMADYIASDRLDMFRMYYKPPSEPGADCEIHLEGPRKYLEHGGIFLHRTQPPSWVAKSWRPEADGRMRVPLQKLRRTGLVQRLFEQIASDTTFHFAYGSRWKAKYLTDLPGEAELLRGLADNGPAATQHRAPSLISAMTHALPFVGSLSIQEILKVRSEISESFEQYRYAISAILREHDKDHLSARDAKEICATELAPKLARLETKLAVETQRFKNRVYATSSIVAIVVSLGMFGLMAPAVGCGLLGGSLGALTSMLAESRSPIPEAATDDLYFLLRMKRAGKRRF